MFLSGDCRLLTEAEEEEVKWPEAFIYKFGELSQIKYV